MGIHQALLISKISGPSRLISVSNKQKEVYYPLGGDGSVRYIFRVDGTHGCLWHSSDTGFYSENYSGEWTAAEAGIGSQYEIKADVVSGAVGGSSSSTGTWLALSGDIYWEVVADSFSSTPSPTATLTISIRDAVSQTVRDTATISMAVYNI